MLFKNETIMCTLGFVFVVNKCEFTKKKQLECLVVAG